MFTSTFDKELELRDVGDGAETSTAAETGISFDASMFNRPFVAVINVTDMDGTSGNETYTVAVETDADTSFGSPTTVGSLSLTFASSTGTYEIPLSGDAIMLRDSTAAAIRVKATLGGTTPSITYGAWLAPAT